MSDNETEVKLNSGVDKDFVQATHKQSGGRKRKALEDKDATRPVKKAKRKRGILRQLMEMPIDILFEIFGHLKPLDLVHMARTTKELRALLMSRSSISVWRTARSSIPGLPDCPNDLSEPRYATLAFGKSCSVGLISISNSVGMCIYISLSSSATEIYPLSMYLGLPGSDVAINVSISSAFDFLFQGIGVYD
ncbi:hypothetical protein HYPSUDRAFT_139140 [Hypholoma sublateritium FD-334 SS-4]|uniref:F-box domain-containing protein n=1 Tax=Hypholoma sublateritium (strain FD-334 SS-4) TaxID=945553 RepID=A0A0D2MFU4_HYPSF|nr:hypothetical protein HYPSUDRAFT_139140 [Hypholoma sublateritium FD-334 SS-4]